MEAVCPRSSQIRLLFLTSAAPSTVRLMASVYLHDESSFSFPARAADGRNLVKVCTDSHFPERFQGGNCYQTETFHTTTGVVIADMDQSGNGICPRSVRRKEDLDE